jgi:putative endonuclease
MNKTEQGQAAEERARRLLEAKGFRFLAANHRTRMGEVDLVMRDGDTVVFVEVRERTREGYGRGFETVTAAKQAKVAKAALSYVKEKRLGGMPLRFDVVSFDPEGASHLPNAFVPPAGRYFI